MPDVVTLRWPTKNSATSHRHEWYGYLKALAHREERLRGIATSKKAMPALLKEFRELRNGLANANLYSVSLVQYGSEWATVFTNRNTTPETTSALAQLESIGIFTGDNSQLSPGSIELQASPDPIPETGLIDITEERIKQSPATPTFEDIMAMMAKKPPLSEQKGEKDESEV
jgi:hypothetical protein